MAINTAAVSSSPFPCPIRTVLRPCTPSSFPTRAGLASPHALACALAVAPRPLSHCWPPELSIVGEGSLPSSLPCFAVRLMLIEFPCFRSPSSSRASAARGARPCSHRSSPPSTNFLAVASSSLVNTFNASSRGEHQHPGCFSLDLPPQHRRLHAGEPCAAPFGAGRRGSTIRLPEPLEECACRSATRRARSRAKRCPTA
jgi:hypothetical protein